MLIPPERLEISAEKVKDYLLVQKEKNDKSGFLLKLGYTKENFNELMNDIKHIASHNEAVLQQQTPFGKMYEVKGNLKNFGIVTIWLLGIDNDKFRFITLFPS
ncbi:MAG: hypothetical protein POELPBGB_03402 [Bacteroidia bacterium]|nr:hypothetical protein [Bacteroidia bacterium]